MCMKPKFSSYQVELCQTESVHHGDALDKDKDKDIFLQKQPSPEEALKQNHQLTNISSGQDEGHDHLQQNTL